MSSNLYKVGDWVYCEVSPYQPFVIRKIEELTKTPCGNVEAKVICAYRYQDIPANIMATVERYQGKNQEKTDSDVANKDEQTKPICDYDEKEVSELNEQQRYQLKHRELYFSKVTDTIAATTIRSKCSVLLFNEEVERYAEYINKEDQFYYHLTYDPYARSIVNDKGEIKVGSRYQTEIPPLKYTPNGILIEEGDLKQIEEQEKRQNDRVLRSQRMGKDNQLPEIPIMVCPEELQWCPLSSEVDTFKNGLTDQEIDQFLILAKSVGTFGRALDCNNAFKQPSLPLSAAYASRDITLFHAMNILHENNYDIGKAALSLISQNGPIVCKDEMEAWSASEANIFEDSLEKYGKDFNEIRKEKLPWKSMKSLIEYYYQWKTTDRYLNQKRIKLADQESKLKQVYIPNLNSKQNQSAIIKSSHVQFFNQYDVQLKSSCESCGVSNSSPNQWYVYNPTNLVQLIMSGNTNPQVLTNASTQAQAALSQANGGFNNNNSQIIQQARLCAECWTYWKKFSSFKYANAKANNLKNQVHKCAVNGCGREFKLKQLLVKHCGVAHGYFAKQQQTNPNNPRQQPIRNRTAFYLYTTPMTKASRLVCVNTIKLRKASRKPFKLIELVELNKEWSKEGRDIAKILDGSKRVPKSDKLTVERIDVISRNRVKILTKKKKGVKSNGLTNGTNGHHETDDQNDAEVEFIADCQNAVDSKPEYFKYFGQRSTSPCFKPEKLAFPKPSVDQINKFHLNLMSLNRKRPHDQTGNSQTNANSVENANRNGSGENGSTESSPLSKRTLLSNHSSLMNGNHNRNLNINNKLTLNNVNNNNNNNTNTKQQAQPRMPQKSMKPTQAINLSNSPEDIYFHATSSLKNTRNQELQNEAQLKLARNPYKLLSDQYSPLYQKFAKFYAKSVAKNAENEMNGNANKNKNTMSEEAAINSDDTNEQNEKQVKANNDEDANGTGEDEEMKQDDSDNPTKKLKVQTNGVESDEADSNNAKLTSPKQAETGSSVVVLD